MLAAVAFAFANFTALKLKCLLWLLLTEVWFVCINKAAMAVKRKGLHHVKSTYEGQFPSGKLENFALSSQYFGKQTFRALFALVLFICCFLSSFCNTNLLDPLLLCGHKKKKNPAESRKRQRDRIWYKHKNIRFRA